MPRKEESFEFGAVGLIPSLFVPDLARALEFYGRLGFHSEWTYPSPGEPTHAGLSFGDVTIMLAKNEPGCRIERQSLYFIVRDVDAYHGFLERAGVEVPGVVEADYQMRDFSMTDPWGHCLTFGQENPADLG